MGAAPLPGRAGQRGADRLHQPGVGVGDNQLHARQAAGDQAAQERQPPGAVLTRGDLQPEDLPLPIGVYTTSVDAAPRVSDGYSHSGCDL